MIRRVVLGTVALLTAAGFAACTESDRESVEDDISDELQEALDLDDAPDRPDRPELP